MSPQRQRLLPRHLDLYLDQLALLDYVVSENEAAAGTEFVDRALAPLPRAAAPAGVEVNFVARRLAPLVPDVRPPRSSSGPF